MARDFGVLNQDHDAVLLKNHEIVGLATSYLTMKLPFSKGPKHCSDTNSQND
jgi:hypothetical protein